MPTPTESPGTLVPGTTQDTPANVPPLAPVPDVASQIAELTEAVNRLVQAQQTQPTQNPAARPIDIGGDIPGGEPLFVAVDPAKLSPLQQITLGLRDAKPVAFTTDPTARPRAGAEPDGKTDDAPSGAD